MKQQLGSRKQSEQPADGNTEQQVNYNIEEQPAGRRMKGLDDYHTSRDEQHRSHHAVNTTIITQTATHQAAVARYVVSPVLNHILNHIGQTLTSNMILGTATTEPGRDDEVRSSVNQARCSTTDTQAKERMNVATTTTTTLTLCSINYKQCGHSGPY